MCSGRLQQVGRHGRDLLEARELWLKENDKNSKFFNKMANAREEGIFCLLVWWMVGS